MARFNITLPDAVRAQLEAEAQQGGTKISTLIAQFMKEHYAEAPLGEYGGQREALQYKLREAEQQADTEVNALKQQLEREQAKAAQKAAEQDARMRELLIKLQAEGENCKHTLAEQEHRIKT